MKRLTNKKITATVDNWPTQHPQGFLRAEILELLESLTVNEALFWEELGPNTVLLNEKGESITYHTDIRRALRGLSEVRPARRWVVLNSEGDILTYLIQGACLYEQWWRLEPRAVPVTRAMGFLFGGGELKDPVEGKSWRLDHHGSCRTISSRELIELGHLLVEMSEEC